MGLYRVVNASCMQPFCSGSYLDGCVIVPLVSSVCVCEASHAKASHMQSICTVRPCPVVLVMFPHSFLTPTSSVKAFRYSSVNVCSKYN